MYPNSIVHLLSVIASFVNVFSPVKFFVKSLSIKISLILVSSEKINSSRISIKDKANS